MRKPLPERWRPAAMRAFSIMAIHGFPDLLKLKGTDEAVGVAKGFFMLVAALETDPHIADDLRAIMPKNAGRHGGDAAAQIINQVLDAIFENTERLEKDTLRMLAKAEHEPFIDFAIGTDDGHVH